MALYFQENEKERSNKRILTYRKKGILGVIFASLLISSAREYLSKIGFFLSTAVSCCAIYQTKTSGQFVRKVAKYGQTD